MNERGCSILCRAQSIRTELRTLSMTVSVSDSEAEARGTDTSECESVSVTDNRRTESRDHSPVTVSVTV